MRRVWFAALLAAVIGLVASSVLLAGQQLPPNVPGMPTIGRMLVVNPSNEAVPVVLGAGGEVQPVTLVGTPSVVVSSESVVATRTTRQAWEYRLEAVKAGQETLPMLNAAGGEGWEVVGVLPGSGGVSEVLLKRLR